MVNFFTHTSGLQFTGMPQLQQWKTVFKTRKYWLIFFLQVYFISVYISTNKQLKIAEQKCRVEYLEARLFLNC